MHAFAGVFIFPLLSREKQSQRCVWDCIQESAWSMPCDRNFQGNVAFWGLKSSFFSGLAGAAPQAGAAVRLKAGAAKIS